MSQQYDYGGALKLMRDARAKRGTSMTRRFIDTVRKITLSLPMYDICPKIVKEYNLTADDDYSNALLRKHGPFEAGRVAKYVNGNGNCLFNSVSLWLIGNWFFISLWIDPLINACMCLTFS
jgi:hypothetical protein